MKKLFTGLLFAFATLFVVFETDVLTFEPDGVDRMEQADRVYADVSFAIEVNETDLTNFSSLAMITPVQDNPPADEPVEDEPVNIFLVVILCVTAVWEILARKIPFLKNWPISAIIYNILNAIPGLANRQDGKKQVLKDED